MKKKHMQIKWKINKYNKKIWGINAKDKRICRFAIKISSSTNKNGTNLFLEPLTGFHWLHDA